MRLWCWIWTLNLWITFLVLCIISGTLLGVQELSWSLWSSAVASQISHCGLFLTFLTESPHLFWLCLAHSCGVSCVLLQVWTRRSEPSCEWASTWAQRSTSSMRWAVQFHMGPSVEPSLVSALPADVALIELHYPDVTLSLSARVCLRPFDFIHLLFIAWGI